MTEPTNEGPLMPAIRYIETGLIWSLALLLTMVSGVLLLVWHMTQSPLGALWISVASMVFLYSAPRLQGWWREGKRLRADLREMKP
jgi:hypothetical protein